ncbi:hypothetical protein ABZ946_34850 [Streptomyces sp. NPDC046324]|uniref:hypothetical protein n=1 Tax=unclassified Streptomyces TaxID=2593676 RepID=UPI003405DBB6
MLSAGLSIAKQWGAVLDPAQLDVALRALEPQLRREHRERMFRLEMQREAAEQAAREKREEAAHKRYMAGLVAGSVVAIAMLGAGVYVAKDSWWLSVLLCGPSLLALVKIFVLRRSDAGDMDAVSGATRRGMNAAGGAQPPPPPVV